MVKVRKKRKKWFQLIFLIISIIILGVGFYVLANQYFSQLVKNQNRVVTIEKNLEETTTLAELETTSIVVSEPTDIKVNSNHSMEASSYAFSTKLVREYIEGSEPYNGNPTVFLTFDDGISQEQTANILDVLQANDVHATFFVVGKSVVPENQTLLSRIIKEGHAIGMHSFNHQYEKLYPKGKVDSRKIAEEANESQKALQSLLGPNFQTHVWRYPGGHMSWKEVENADNMIRAYNIEWIDWNASVGDGLPKDEEPKSISEMMEYHQDSLTRYSETGMRVILMHDSGSKELTVETLPSLIQFYKDKGFQFGILE